MVDFGRRPGDMFKSVYDTDDDGVVDGAGAVEAHAASHQDAGTDEISVTGLAGELAADQPPKAHLLGSATHTEDTLANLTDKVSDATLDDSADSRTPSAHAASHQDGGADEISASGLVGAGGFVDRGDPAAYDWTQATLTTDATWLDLDCSSIVPAGATGIVFNVSLNDDVVASYFFIRKKGNTNTVNASRMRVQVANLTIDQTLFSPCDSNRYVQYKGSNLAFVLINVTIMGWFI